MMTENVWKEQRDRPNQSFQSTSRDWDGVFVLRCGRSKTCVGVRDVIRSSLAEDRLVLLLRELDVFLHERDTHDLRES